MKMNSNLVKLIATNFNTDTVNLQLNESKNKQQLEDFLSVINKRKQNFVNKQIDKDLILNKTKLTESNHHKIYKAKYLRKEIIVKKFRSTCNDQAENLKEAFKNMLSEIETFGNLTSEFIPKFIGYYIAKKINLVFEYHQGELLTNCYKEKTKSEKLLIIKQVASFLDIIHKNKLIYKELRPDNIIVGKDNKILITSYPSSNPFKNSCCHSYNSNNSNIIYVAPEAFHVSLDTMNEPLIIMTDRFDIWSLGCLTSEIFSGVRPWCNSYKNMLRIIKALVKQEEFPIPESLDEDIKGIIGKMCAINPSERYSAMEVMSLVEKLSYD
jgi:serine/threonine protein kinase